MAPPDCMSEGHERNTSAALLEDESGHLAALAHAGAAAWDVLDDAGASAYDTRRAFDELDEALWEAAKHHKVPGEDEAYKAYELLGKRLGVRLRVALDEEGHARRAA